MPSNRIVTPRRWLCLLALGLAAIIRAAAPGPSFAAEQPKFVLPLVVNGITYQGEGVLTEDGSIVVTVRIVYRQAVPGPQPEPKPEPKPAPTPNKISTLYLIHESGDGTPQFTGIRNAAGWKSECDKLGIKYLIADVDTARPKIPQAVKLAVSKGLPAIVLLDAQGLGVAEACPKTPDAMLARVKATVKP